MVALRRWLRDVLLALAAWLDPDRAGGLVDVSVASAAAVPAEPMPTPLELAARMAVARLDPEPYSHVSKRQLAYRELQAAFPGARMSDLNFAIEDAVRRLVAARKEPQS